MKPRRTAALFALLSAACLQSLAQTESLPLNAPDYNKPKIFADLPEKTPLQLDGAEALLALPVGAGVNTALATGFRLTGTVVSKSDPGDSRVRSVVVKCPARSNAVFSFSRIENADGSFSYTGRMWAKAAGDALELAKDGAAYVFRKKGHYDLVNE